MIPDWYGAYSDFAVSYNMRTLKNGESTMEDEISRKRLKKKVLERWENEGGRLCAIAGSMPESSPPSNRERKTSEPSHDSSAEVNDRPSAGKRKP